MNSPLRIPLVRVRFSEGSGPELAVSPSQNLPSAETSAALWSWADAKVMQLRETLQCVGRRSRVLSCQLVYANDDFFTHQIRLDGVLDPTRPLSLAVQREAYLRGTLKSLHELRTYDFGPSCDDVLAPTRVRSAIRFTSGGYLDRCLRQRLEGPEARGSVFTAVSNPRDLLHHLMQVAWKPYAHPEVLPNCAAFRAPMPGRLGVVDLRTFDPHAKIVTLADPKGTGELSAHVTSEEAGTRTGVDFAVMILGPNEENPGMPEMVWTFHPGDPIRPSSTPATPGGAVQEVTVAEALARGFVYAKVSG